MATPPRIPRAQTPLAPDTDMHIVIQGGKRTLASNAEVLAGAKTVKGDTGPAGPQGAPGPVGPAGAAGPTGLQGSKGDTGATGAKGDTGAASAVPGPTGSQGATGPAGAPLRVETFTGTSNASGVATIPLSPAFTSITKIVVDHTWAGDQIIGGGVTANTLSSVTVLVKRSRGALLLTTGPFETAPNTQVNIIVFGR